MDEDTIAEYKEFALDDIEQQTVFIGISGNRFETETAAAISNVAYKVIANIVQGDVTLEQGMDILDSFLAGDY